MRFLSVCSGIEAASVAWEPLGWKALAFSEIEAFPRAVLRHHYPDVPLHGDFAVLRDEAWIIDADVLVGGTPCQAFSVAGLRRSLDDDRGNLSLEFVRLADAIDDLRCADGRRAAIIVWENVPGVLSTKDNAFGCFLAGLVGEDTPLVPGRKQRWTDAGLVIGPRRAAAWRTLDAQYFGLAQRRRRVFVVASARDGFNPAAVLFERHSLSGNPPPRREAGEGIAAATAPSLTASGRGGERTGESRGQDPVVAVAFGGNNQSGPIDVATALNAHGGPHGRQDFESETFIAHSLRAEGFDASEDGTGRGTPLVPVPILEAGARTGKSIDDPRAGIGIGEPCDPMFTLQSGKQHAIAFDCRAGGKTGLSIDDIPGALRGEGYGGGHAAVAFHENQRAEVTLNELAGSLKVGGGKPGQGYPAIAQNMAVRRLTPRECERLQGFKDDYTLITYRGKPAADGPRYKALGNSMAVPCMRWIGERIVFAIQAAEEA